MKDTGIDQLCTQSLLYLLYLDNIFLKGNTQDQKCTVAVELSSMMLQKINKYRAIALVQ